MMRVGHILKRAKKDADFRRKMIVRLKKAMNPVVTKLRREQVDRGSGLPTVFFATRIEDKDWYILVSKRDREFAAFITDSRERGGEFVIESNRLGFQETAELAARMIAENPGKWGRR